MNKVTCLCGNKVEMTDKKGKCSKCKSEYYEQETIRQQLAGWDRNKPKEDSNDFHS